MGLKLAGTVTWTSVGTHSWQAGFAVTYGEVVAIGGGGSGFRDDDTPPGGGPDGTNGKGAGGGGGGYASQGVNLTPLSFYQITVGAGGAAPPKLTSNNGGSSSFSGPGAGVTGVGGQGGGDRYGGAGGSPGGSPGSNDGGEKVGGNRAGGGAGGAPSGGTNGGGWGRTLEGGIVGPSGKTGGSYGGGGAGNKDGQSDPAGAGGQGAVKLTYYYSEPTVSCYINNTSLNEGETATFTYARSYSDGYSVEGDGIISQSGSAAVVQPSVSSGCSQTKTYKVTATGPGGSATCSQSLTVYKKPVIDSFTISNSSPLAGDTVTVYWTTTCASSVSLVGSTGAFGGSSPSSLSVNGSFSFVNNKGGYYTVKLEAYNANSFKVETIPISFTVRDETPDAFEWTTSDTNAPPNTMIESNSISIKGFSPTQYVDNKLPIKSNYPIQVMVNGDGVWRDVQQI